MQTQPHPHDQGKLYLKKAQQSKLMSAIREHKDLWDRKYFQIPKDSRGRQVERIFSAQGGKVGDKEEHNATKSLTVKC